MASKSVLVGWPDTGPREMRGQRVQLVLLSVARRCSPVPLPHLLTWVSCGEYQYGEETRL